MSVSGRKPSTEAARTGAGHRQHADPSQAGGYIVELEPPEELSKGGLEVWEVVVPDLVKSGVLRADDLVILVECCEAWAIARKFRSNLWAALDTQDTVMAELELLLGTGVAEADDFKIASARAEAAEASVKRARSGWTAAFKAALSSSADLGLGPVARVRLGLTKLQGASLLGELDRQAGSGTQPSGA